MKKTFILLILLSSICYADEPLLDFKEESIPVFNEEQRQTKEDIRMLQSGVGGVVTFTADDVTPDVSGGKVFLTVANTGATAITDLDNPTVGQFVYIIGTSATNSPTIADSDNFKLSGAWTGSVDEVLVLYIKADNYYVEISRSVN